MTSTQCARGRSREPPVAAMARAPKRFIKKVPPSGGPPAFKLTLPHQVVHRHLLHLVDTDFELAPSATAQQTWQGSIAPRRNKERSEYTLQGWKLFAEAHKVQAGDQVSFELVSSHRMVIQIIRPLEQPLCPQEFLGSQLKVSKATETSTPGGHRSQQLSPTPVELRFPTEPSLWLNDSALDNSPTLEEEWQTLSEALQPPAASEEDSTEMEATRQMAAASQAFENVMSGQSPSMSEGRCRTSSPSLSKCLSLGEAHGSYNSLPLDQLGSSSLPQRQQPLRSSSLSNLPPSSPAMSSIFKDLLQTSAVESEMTGPLPLGPSEIQEDSSLLFKGPSTGSHLNLQLGNLTVTIQSLQNDVQCFEARADKAEGEASTLRDMLDKLQESLDRQSRDALRAATGLERTTGRLATPHLLADVDSKTAERLMEIQSDMFNCLSLLKGSLWQLLIMTINNDTDQHALSPDGQARQG